MKCGHILRKYLKYRRNNQRNHISSHDFEPLSNSSVQLGMRTTMAAQHRMETSMSIKTKFAALALATLAVTGTIASTTQAQAKPLTGASAPASLAPRLSAPRSPLQAPAITTTAIAAAAGFASSTLSAITSAASGPAVTDFCG